MKGRKRKPTEQKIAEGNRGKRKLEPEKEPQYSTDNLVPTKKLSKHAQEEWNRLSPIITKSKVFTEADTAALTLHCETYATFVRATNELEQDGGLFTFTKAGITTHPAVRIQNNCAALILKFLAEFGLTPASRSKVIVNPEVGNNDEFSKFQKEREKRRADIVEINRTQKTA